MYLHNGKYVTNVPVRKKLTIFNSFFFVHYFILRTYSLFSILLRVQLSEPYQFYTLGREFRYLVKNSFGIDQFKIISNGMTDVECKIKEALNIKNSNPTLNQNLFQHGSSFLIFK